jgi:hypothetical protein
VYTVGNEHCPQAGDGFLAKAMLMQGIMLPQDGHLQPQTNDTPDVTNHVVKARHIQI